MGNFIKKGIIVIIALVQLTMVGLVSAQNINKNDREAESVANMVAYYGKRALVQERGEFPIDLGQNVTLEDIKSEGRSVIYDYNMGQSSDGFTPETLNQSLNTLLSQKRGFCDNAAFLTMLDKYQLQLIYNYRFSDDVLISTALNVNEICQSSYQIKL